jgi:phosphatidylglycerophosphate synthase
MLVMSWQLPRAPLLTSVIVAAAAWVVATVMFAATLGPAVGTSDVYPAKAALIFCMMSGVALGFVHTHPFGRFGAANQVTTGRAALAALVAAMIGEPLARSSMWAVVVVTAAISLLDGLDGWAARRSGMVSEFGARYDMEVDAVLIAALAVLAWLGGKAGIWITLAGAWRYLFVGASYACRWLNAPLPPSLRRKAACVLQIGGLAAVLAPVVPPSISSPVAAVTLAVLSWSFSVDILWLRRHRA